MKCEYHLCGNETSTRFCRNDCKNKFYVDIRRKKLKVLSVKYKGGKCQECGYNKSYAALEFHHRDPSQKSFSLSNPQTRAWSKMKIELDKCDLVCANCHREIENRPFEFKYNLISTKEIENELKYNRRGGEIIRNKCVDCNAYITKKALKCKHCVRQVDRPSKEWLEQLIYMLPMTEVGKLYEVTDNTIRKWCGYYKIQVPKFGAKYWHRIKR